MVRVNNILTFSVLLHKVASDSEFMTCDISYIWDKYQSMIGIDPLIRGDEESDWWQSVVLKDFSAMSLKLNWMTKWNANNKKIDPKKERVLNYICLINNTPNLTPSNIFNIFEEYIGKVENVTPIEYSHIHPILKEFVNKYKEKNQRELNLEIFTRGL